MNSERKAFEEAFPIPAHWIEYDEKLNKYYCHYASDYAASIYQARWEAWQASTQRQGYKLVPVEPTKNMEIAGMNAGAGFVSRSIYKAMIEAINE